MKMMEPKDTGDFFGAMVQFPDTAVLRKELLEFGGNLAAKHLGAAMRRASQPALQALRRETPKGPTGNLRRAITSKVVRYPQDGNAVLIVGYTKAGTGKATSAGGGKVKKGKDRAFHAGFLEFGTKERTVTGGIASSYRSIGPFKFKRSKNGRVSTQPKYPKAFFMRAKKGETPRLGRTRPQAPIATAFAMSSGAMASGLAKELGTAVEKARKELAYRISSGV